MLASLAGVTAVAWAYLVVGAAGMESTAVSGMGGMLTVRAWDASDLGLMFMMWAVMMVGMMVPTAIPMAMIYASVARKAASQGSILAPTAVFVSGYLLVWSLFSMLATLLQWQLNRASLLSPMMVLHNAELGAGLLIVAGLYQMTPLKQACLRHCRSPAHFIAAHWRPGTAGAVRMGAEHGIFCLGCCWLLMLLLFVGGVMNLLWIALITAFVLLEKISVRGEVGGRAAGVAMVVVGALMLWSAGAG